MKKSQDGFTLIELLVVITIIGVLTSLFIANMVSVRERAKDARLKSNLNEFKTALRLYYNDNQNYPPVLTIQGLNPGDTFEAGSTVYMQDAPEFTTGTYALVNNGDGFRIGVDLNNATDEEICESWTRCGVTGTCEVGTDTTYYICSE